MWLIDQTEKYHSDISQSLESDLKKWWHGKLDASRSDRLIDSIKKIHSQKLWIACDCNSRNELPVLAPALRGSTYYVVRLTKRGKHDQNCPFYFEQQEVKEGEGIPTNGVESIGSIPDFNAPKVGEGISHSNKTLQDSERDNRTPRTPAIAKRLWWLLQTSGVQSSKVQYPIRPLLELAAKIPFGRPGQTLKDGLFCHPDSEKNGWLKASLFKQIQIGLKPVCWWIFEISDANLKDRTVFLKGKGGAGQKIPVEGSIRIWAGDVSPARFPMLAIARITLIDGGLSIQELYAHPVQGNGSWMLVDSNHERNAVDDLKSVATWLHNAKGISISFEKPLFEWNNTGEKPDFVLTKYSASKQSNYCIVETMGFDDHQYLTRKSELRKKLITVAEVIMDERVNNPEASLQLKREVARWAIRK